MTIVDRQTRCFLAIEAVWHRTQEIAQQMLEATPESKLGSSISKRDGVGSEAVVEKGIGIGTVTSSLLVRIYRRHKLSLCMATNHSASSALVKSWCARTNKGIWCSSAHVFTNLEKKASHTW
jgi:hypothetical protein